MGGNPDITSTYAQTIATITSITALVVAITAMLTIMNTLWIAYIHRKQQERLHKENGKPHTDA